MEEVSQIGWVGCGLGVVNNYIKVILHSLAHVKGFIIQQYGGPPCEVDAGGNPATKWYFTIYHMLCCLDFFIFAPQLFCPPDTE